MNLTEFTERFSDKSGTSYVKIEPVLVVVEIIGRRLRGRTYMLNDQTEAKDSNLTQPREKQNHLIRQRRLELLGEECFLKISELTFEVIDCSAFGLSILTKVNDPILDEYLDVTLSYQMTHISTLHLKKVRKQSMQGTDAKVVFEIVGEPVEIQKIKAIKAARKILKEQLAETSETSEVPDNFRKLVFEMKDWLDRLKYRVNSLINYSESINTEETSIFENTISQVVGNFIVEQFQPLYKQLGDSLKDCDQSTVTLAFDFFRSKLKQLLLEAPFHNRAFNKPLGYAGDYQMMNQIYSRQSLGETLFAKCLHLYFVSAPESKAVRNRARYLTDKIKDVLLKENRSEHLNILSVASGPAFEIQNLIREYPELLKNVTFHLLDQDAESLEYTQKNIKNLSRQYNVQINCKFIHRTIKNVISSGLKDTKYDFIYSAGLFDYFSDPVAQVAAQRLMEGLKSNCSLIIGNFDISSPGKLTMDMALDWHLIYRSREDLKRLFNHLAKSFSVEKEEEGINLFCNLLKE